MSTSLGKRIRQARLATSLTQSQLGRACGVSHAAISQWESGVVTSVSAEALALIAKRCGVSLDWLLTGGDPSSREPSADYHSDDTIRRIISLLPHLTSQQRSDILRQIESVADSNQRILAELAKR